MFRGSDICLLVYAMDDEQSFFNLDIWKREFLYYADIKDPDTFPFVLLGNKCDLDAHLHEVKEEDVSKWCKENGNMNYYKTSAKDSINVDLAFSASVERWVESEKRLDKQMKTSPSYTNEVNLKNKQGNKESTSSGGCC